MAELKLNPEKGYQVALRRINSYLGKPERLLVVEDNEIERRAVSQVLRNEGYRVYGAENADRALRYLDERIDLVLSDLYMGDVSGLDLLRLWKKKRPDTPFILYTGHSSIDSAVEAIKAGAYEYVTKPVNPDELALLIRRAIDAVQKQQGELDLSGLSLEQLPPEIGRLTALAALDLRGNRLTALPPEIGRLTALAALDLRGNRLTALPPEIGSLTALAALDLAGNQLTALPPEIGNLTALAALDLGGNQLAVLPPEIGQLTALTQLVLQHNQLTALPPEIGQLTALTQLFLHNNQLTALPTELGDLLSLQTLDLGDNLMVALPKKIGELTQLRELFVSGNKRLQTLPEEIGLLKSLSRLHLHNDEELVSLPDEICQLPLTELFLHGAPKLKLPPETLGPSWEDVRDGKAKPASPQAILDYYFRTRRGVAQELREAKVLILGQGAVGKTSLAKGLTGEPFDKLESATHGINISEWSMGQWPAGAEHGGVIRVHIWDFGGQEIMHATHQFFLTERSLYLLVLDSRKGENESNLRYWLKIVASYGGDSPVIIVMNKSDQYNMRLDERAIYRDCPNVRGFISTSAMTGEGIPELRKLVAREIVSLPHVFNRVPHAYMRVKSVVEKQSRENDFLELAEFVCICEARGVNGADEQRSLLRFLHDLGSVLNFDDPQDPYGLKDTKILNPLWITGAVYKIINNPLLQQQREGELELRELGRILDDHKRYPPAKHAYIMALMRKFELCFEFPHSNGARFLIPELLPFREPELKWPEGDVLAFEYHYDVLPSGILCRLIVRSARYLADPPVYWRSGAVFQIRSNPVLVRSEPDRKRMVIEIAGNPETRAAALAAIRAELEHIHATIPKLSVKAMIPLPKDRNVQVSFEHLQMLERLGETRFIPEGADRQYEISELLTGIRPPEAARPTLYLKKLVLKNIRCFEQLELDFDGPRGFRALTMLLGDNGAGKTTILRCIALAFCDETNASALMAQLPGEMLYAKAETGSICLTCAEADSTGPGWKICTNLVRGRGNTIELTKDIPPNFPSRNSFVCGYGAARNAFGDRSYQRYEIADSARSLFDYSASLQNPELIFRRISQAGHDLNELCRRLSQLMELDDSALQLSGTGVTLSGARGDLLPIDAAGDGYRATLAWLADFLGWALFYDDRFVTSQLTGIVLVDEIEKHLHPRWQRLIIRRLHEQFPNVQFIVTSHSPICAGGVSDLEEREGLLYHFPVAGEEPVRMIEPPAGWRYDQIVTSSAFGLPSARDVTTEAIQARLLAAHVKYGEKARDSKEFKQAMEELESRSVNAAQDEEDRQNRARLARELEAVKTLLEERRK